MSDSHSNGAAKRPIFHAIYGDLDKSPIERLRERVSLVTELRSRFFERGAEKIFVLPTPLEEAERTETVTPAPSDSFVTLDQLEELCHQQPSEYLVEGLLPANDIHIAVGDSGLGKTPWAYQLGLCVASGQPFLDHPVKQGRVLYFDLENGREEILSVGRSICGYLAIEGFPPEFLVLQDNGNVPRLERAVKKHEPSLVIVDTLRALYPDVEKNDRTARFLQETRQLARSCNCAFLLLHHVRKPGENGVLPLEDTPTMQWLNEASGARSLINQTNTRIAFDKTGKHDAAFVMKYFVKLQGESGPMYLERVCNQDGEPIGYRSIVGVGLLGNFEQEAAFARLPEGRFTFKEAMRIYGRSDDPTRKFLIKCIAANLIRQVDRGVYERLV